MKALDCRDFEQIVSLYVIPAIWIAYINIFAISYKITYALKTPRVVALQFIYGIERIDEEETAVKPRKKM